MESPPISRIRFTDGNGNCVEAPAEWSPALVELTVPVEQWERCRLWLQGRELPLRATKLSGRASVVAEWPLANPGHYRLQATWPDGAEECTVSIKPRKISEASFSQLLQDLESEFPPAIAIALQQMGALAGIKLLPASETTLAQELVRLRRAIDGAEGRAGLVQALTEIAKRPHELLAHNEIWVKAEQARRPHPARFNQAISRGYNRSAHGQLKTLVDTRVEHSFDVYENRLLRTFSDQVDRRLTRVLRYLSRKARESPLWEQVAALSDRFKRARRQAAFLDGLKPSRHLPMRVTMVLLNRPDYRAVFQGYLEFHKSTSIDMDLSELDSPLENLPRLYQLWGTLCVFRALLDVGADLGYLVAEERLIQRGAEGLYLRVLPDGLPCVVLKHPQSKTIVKLIPERTFGGTGRFRSISFAQRPDIAIEIESPVKSPSIYLFDPKYKLQSEEDIGDFGLNAGPKKVDIDKMHSYRDAIRDERLHRVVHYAAILYPGPDVRYLDEIEALSALPESSTLLKAHLKQVLAQALG